MNRNQTAAAALVVVLAAAGVSVAGLAGAASAGSVTADPATPGTTSTHAVTVTVGNETAGSSWTGFQVTYNRTDVGNVGQTDVARIGIDRGDDAAGTTIDERVANDLGGVSAGGDGTRLTFSLGGNYDLEAGDEVVVVYEDAVNPDTAGTYTVGLDVNHQSTGGEATASLVVESQDTTTTTTTTSSTSTTTSTTTTDDGSGGGGDTTTTTTSGDSVPPSEPSVAARPSEPNATATHAVTLTVGTASEGSWTGLQVNYTATDVSNVGQNDVAKLGIDRGDDAPGTNVDVDVSDDLSTVDGSQNGTLLTVGLGGNYDLDAGDEVVVVYGDVQNPPNGAYKVPLDVNPQSSGGTDRTTLAVFDDFTTTTSSSTQTSTATPTESSTTTVTTAESTTAAQSPGFGTLAALVGLLGAASLALRD